MADKMKWAYYHELKAIFIYRQIETELESY